MRSLQYLSCCTIILFVAPRSVSAFTHSKWAYAHLMESSGYAVRVSGQFRPPAPHNLCQQIICDHWYSHRKRKLPRVHAGIKVSLAAAAAAAAVAAAVRVVVVTGATGRIGSALVRELQARNNNDTSVGHFRVIALVRDAAKAKTQFDGGVEVHVADYSDTVALDKAFQTLGSTPLRLFLACSNSPAQSGLELNVLNAAVSHGCCEQVVKLSTVRTVLDAMSGGPYKAHLEVEDALKSSSHLQNFVILRPNLFMQTMHTGALALAKDFRTANSYTHPYSNAQISMIDGQDVAAVAAVLLCSADPASHSGETLDLTGSVTATGQDFATSISKYRPNPVTCTTCAVEDLVNRMGVPAHIAVGIRSFLEVLGKSDFVTDTVNVICGRPARTVDDYVQDHSTSFLPATFSKLVGKEKAASFRSAATIVEVDMQGVLAALGPSQVLIKVQIAGINGGADTFRVTNAQPGATNFPLGAEGSGLIVAVGSEVVGLRVGDTVSFISLRESSYAEYVPVDTKTCRKVLRTLPLQELTALRVSGHTAAVALGRTAEVKAGDTVLVTAACGATGSFAVQLAKLAGATVVGTVGSDSKVATAKELGCDRVVNYRSEDLGQVLKEEFPKGLDIVYDGVGGSLFAAAYENLAVGGRILVVGAISTYPHNETRSQHGIEGVKDIMDIFASGETLDLPEGRQIIGNVWGDAFTSGAIVQERDRIHNLYEKGQIRALVEEREFKGLESVPDAVDYMLSGTSIGKVWVRCCE